MSSAFAGRVVAVDETVAKRAAGLHVPDPAPLRDVFIAATALVQRMDVVTRNVKDFERFDGAGRRRPLGMTDRASQPATIVDRCNEGLVGRAEQVGHGRAADRGRQPIEP